MSMEAHSCGLCDLSQNASYVKKVHELVPTLKGRAWTSMLNTLYAIGRKSPFQPNSLKVEGLRATERLFHLFAIEHKRTSSKLDPQGNTTIFSFSHRRLLIPKEHFFVNGSCWGTRSCARIACVCALFI